MRKMSCFILEITAFFFKWHEMSHFYPGCLQIRTVFFLGFSFFFLFVVIGLYENNSVFSNSNYTDELWVPHGGQVPRDDVQGLNRVLRDLVQVTRQRLQQHLQADDGHPLQRHLKGLVLPLAWKSHLQIHLRRQKEI